MKKEKLTKEKRKRAAEKKIGKKGKELIGGKLISETENEKKESTVIGGIIGILFTLIYFFIVNYLPSLNRFICVPGKENLFNCFWVGYIQTLGFPAFITKMGFLKNLGMSAKGILAVIFILLFYMLLGALIGYLYGKIREERK